MCASSLLSVPSFVCCLFLDDSSFLLSVCLCVLCIVCLFVHGTGPRHRNDPCLSGRLALASSCTLFPLMPKASANLLLHGSWRAPCRVARIRVQAEIQKHHKLI